MRLRRCAIWGVMGILIGGGSVFAAGIDPEQLKREAALIYRDVCRILETADPGELLGGDVTKYIGVPDSNMCGYARENVGNVMVSMYERSDFDERLKRAQDEPRFLIRTEEGLGERAFSAVRDEGEIIEITAIKGAKTVEVHFATVPNRDMDRLRDFTRRVLDGF